jgi:hypothetical protein
MFPATGLCMIGAVNPFLTTELGAEASFYVTVVSCFVVILHLEY